MGPERAKAHFIAATDHNVTRACSDSYSGVRLIRRTNQPLPCAAAGSDFTHDAVALLWALPVRADERPGSLRPGPDGLLKFGDQRSTHRATPMPPPMHSAARPFLVLRFCISCRSVTSTRAPDAPIGWPMAIPPPLTFTISSFQPMSLLTAQACAAKASLASTRSRSETFQPAFSSVLREAGIGPVPMMAGSTPAVAQEAMR